MRKTLLFALVMFSAIQLGIAAEQSVPTRSILPEDVVQDSVHQWRMSTNKYAVGWTYTEAGAKKMLAFREAHEGQKVRMVIGNFESQPSEDVFRPMPPHFTTYAQWKEGWLKYRTDKFHGMSEDEAKAIVAGLKGK